jgi:prepilin-type N-terminal cleavage/methylation domain-containing protein
MQIFSTSHTFFSSHNRKAAGFTLVELLISIGIIGMVTAIVIVKYSSFDSSVLLKDAAYEIALALREAQIKSVSVVRTGSGTNAVNYPYGVSFTPGQQRYFAFQYPSATAYPKYIFSAITLATTTIGRTMEVYDVCVYGTALADPCSISKLDVSFRRPEYKAYFWATAGSNNYDSNTITNVTIKVRSRNGGDVFVVEVTSLGQISVCKQGAPNCT